MVKCPGCGCSVSEEQPSCPFCGGALPVETNSARERASRTVPIYRKYEEARQRQWREQRAARIQGLVQIVLLLGILCLQLLILIVLLYK